MSVDSALCLSPNPVRGDSPLPALGQRVSSAPLLDRHTVLPELQRAIHDLEHGWTTAALDVLLRLRNRLESQP